MDDDRTIVGEQAWQGFGAQELTVLPQPPLLDEKTSRAFRAACWTWCAIGLLVLAVAALVLAGLVVGIFGDNPPAP